MANTKTESIRGADLIVRMLVDAGVNRIFALSGNQIMPLFDACIDTGIEIIHVRHEAAAVYMAESYARFSGGPGVALVTAGGGLCNTVGALYSVSESETPVLLLSGDSPVSLDGQGAFQELNQVAVTAPLTRWSHRVTDPDELGHELAQALQKASVTRPGPVHLAVPVDVLNAQVELYMQEMPAVVANAEVDAEVAMVIDVLSKANNPLVLVGPALSAPHYADLLKRIEKAHAVPVVIMESPRGLNDPALAAISQVIADSDVIVSLGKRMDFGVGFGKTIKADCYVVLADASLIDQARSNLGEQCRGMSVANVREFAHALANADSVPPARYTWLSQVASLIAVADQSSAPVTDRITPAQLCAQVQKQMDLCEAPVLICDGGEFGQWAQACLSADKRMINGLSGSIGAGICYGLGAAVALPDSVVFVLTGDGSLGFHLAEFETAVRHGVSFVVIVGNDGRWNAEHQLQLREYGNNRLYGCELSDAGYHDAVVAMGGYGEHVTDAAQIPAALNRAVSSGSVACVNVMIAGEAAPVSA